MKGFFHHYSIIYKVLTLLNIESTWKTKFKLGKGWRKVSLKFALDFLLHFRFAPSQSSHPADDQFKPFHEPGDCSSALAALSRDHNGQQSTGGTGSSDPPADPQATDATAA